MAACEGCGTGGFNPPQMHASQDGKLLIGPCCQAEAELDWGLSLSSKNGLELFAKYGDLKISYQKSPQELKELVDRIQ